MKNYREKTLRSVAELFWTNVIKAPSPSDVQPIIDAGRHFFVRGESERVVVAAAAGVERARGAADALCVCVCGVVSVVRALCGACASYAPRKSQR